MEDSVPTLASGPTSNSNPPIMEESSAKLFFCRWVRHRIPLAHREEFYHILRMTGPLVRTGTAHLACCVLLWVSQMAPYTPYIEHYFLTGSALYREYRVPFGTELLCGPVWKWIALLLGL